LQIPLKEGIVGESRGDRGETKGGDFMDNSNISSKSIPIFSIYVTKILNFEQHHTEKMQSSL
jgi:hypothetical protein